MALQSGSHPAQIKDAVTSELCSLCLPGSDRQLNSHSPGRMHDRGSVRAGKVAAASVCARASWGGAADLRLPRGCVLSDDGG